MSSTIIALGIVTFIFAYLFVQLGNDEGKKKHFIFQFILLFFILMGVFLMSKASYDNPDSCEWLLNTTTLSGNTTSYDHYYQCADNTSSTNDVFVKLTSWFIRISILYIALYFLYEIFVYMGWIVQESE